MRDIALARAMFPAMSIRPPLQPPAGRRVRHTSYGSPLLARASRVAPRLNEIQGTGLRALLAQLWGGLIIVTAYWLALPTVEVPLSDGPAGDVLRQQLSLRDRGRLSRRRAQGVLILPGSGAEYLRGRHRQAVRTNVRRAREEGMRVGVEHIADFGLYAQDPRSAHITARAPMEMWTVFDAGDQLVARAELTISGRAALLHIATSETSYARWLLHTSIVERLCGECDLLLTNTDDVPLMPAGAQHYQRLLGYSIVRLRLAPAWTELLAAPSVRILGLCLAAATAIVANRWALGPDAGFGERALVWVTALVAVRRASYRAGAAAVAGLLAAAGLLVIDGFAHPLVAFGYLLGAVALDVLLAVVPRLTWGAVSVTPAGVATTLLALAATALAGLHRRADPAAMGSSVWLSAAGFGAVAAALGWWLGGRLLPFTTGRIEPKSPPKSGFTLLTLGNLRGRRASPIASSRGRSNPERSSFMLTLTPTASAAVHALLDNPELPDSSGIRLQSQTDAAGRPGIGIEVVSAPIDGDQLVPAGDGHDVFLSPDVAPVLDDQVLDAELDERRVAFSLRPQALDGQVA